MREIAAYEYAQSVKHPDAGNYKSFSDIPEHLVCESFLMAWLQQDKRFSSIPRDLWTDQLVTTAIRNDSFAFAIIKPEDVSDYRKLMLEFVRFGMGGFDQLPAEYKTEQFVIDMSAWDPRPMDLSFLKDHPHLITQRVADEICSKSFNHAYDFWMRAGDTGRKFVTDAHLERAIRADSSHLDLLVDLKKEHILVDMISQGYWPSKDQKYRPSPVDHKPVRPERLKGLPELLCLNILEGHKFLYRCWIKTKPVDEVVDAYHGYKAGIDELFCLYEEKTLRSYADKYRSLRGRFLENDLGM